MPSAPILEAKNLTVGYRESKHSQTAVSSGINLQIRPGKLVCLLGPNGAGKSTLLRTVAGMQIPLAGEVLLEGANIHKKSAADLARVLSVVLTERVTVGMLTSYELVSLGRYPFTGWAGTLSTADHRIVASSIEAVGAQALAYRQVSELSDGERQKIMLARALAQEPRLMILDEITAFLDLPRRVEIMHILRDLAHNHNCTILLSTHDLELALRSGDSIWLMSKGKPIRAGAPEDLVLNGAFAETFRSEGVEFNETLGSFHIPVKTERTVELIGDGLTATWTARALERSGFLVMAPGSDCANRVEIFVDSEKPVWHSRHAGEARQHYTLERLVAEFTDYRETPGNTPA